MLTVGGPAGAGGGAGAVVTGGVGAVGPGESVLPLEHAVNDVSETRSKKRSGIILDAGGATGQGRAYHKE